MPARCWARSPSSCWPLCCCASVPRGLPVPETPSRRRHPGSGGLAACAALAAVLVILGPAVLDEYSVNTLIRSFLYGSIAVTVDVLWGYTGILTFGQAVFFGIGAYALGLAVTTYDFTTPVVIGAFL